MQYKIANMRQYYLCVAGIRSPPSKGLRRNQHNAVIQLRIGHIPLQAYLHKIKKADSEDCPACLSHGRHTAETVHHYLFDCPAYRAQRERVSRALGRDARNKHILLGTKKGLVAILRYMADTKRFTNIFGDVSAFRQDYTEE